MYLMVLNDGETYTNLENCMIVDIPDNYDVEGIEEELKAIHEGPFMMKQGGAVRIFAFPKGHRLMLEDKTAMSGIKIDI